MDRGRSSHEEGAGRRLTCRFEDGRVLRIAVSPAEADDLARRGVSVSPAKRFLLFLARHSGWWIGIVVAALIAPAIGKQWSDRNQELSLKRGLVADLSSAVATSITRAEEIARQGGPGLDRQNALDAWIRNQSSLTGSFVVYFPRGAVHQLWSNTLKKREGSNWIGFRDSVYDYIELS